MHGQMQKITHRGFFFGVGPASSDLACAELQSFPKSQVSVVALWRNGLNTPRNPSSSSF
jgi:hypothetical protein